MSFVTLTVDDLLLDVDNPRLAKTINSQREALEEIVREQGDKLANLAEDIVENGLDPGQAWYVVLQDKDKKYIVLEGNRRLAALKILNNLSLLDSLNVTKKFKEQFKRANNSNAKIEKVTCVPFANRHAAKSWIEKLHTGENEGRGRVTWSGEQKARFRGDSVALKILDQFRPSNSASGAFPITTLERIIENPKVREELKLDADGNVSGNENTEALKKIVEDLDSKKVKVDAVKTAEQQIAYVQHIKRTPSPSAAKEAALPNNPPAPSQLQESPLPATKSPRVRTIDHNNRKTLIPSDYKLRFDGTSTKAQGIFQELKKMEFTICPKSIAVMLRVFLELSVDKYFERNSLDTKITNNGKDTLKTLNTKAKECIKHLIECKTVEKKMLDTVYGALDKAGHPLSIVELNQYVHSNYAFPQVDALKDAWGTADPLFRAIWSNENLKKDAQ
jgi:hypothetical protein